MLVDYLTLSGRGGANNTSGPGMHPKRKIVVVPEMTGGYPLKFKVHGVVCRWHHLAETQSSPLKS